ncbi:MAG: hypothetical protein ACYTGX_15385 [Planctomycetota bacterium]|jgi:hypothetical protein
MGNQATGLALGICIGLAAGLTAGYGGLGSSDPAPDGLAGDLGGSESGEGAGGLGADEPAPLSGLPGGSGSATAPGTQPEAAGDQPGDTSDAEAAAADAPSAPAAVARRGNGTITARVTTDDGKPVSGVRVELIETRTTAAAGGGWRRGDPAPADMSALAPPNLFLARTTGADGRVSFSGLPEGSNYAMGAFHQGLDVRNSTSRQQARSGYWSRRGQWVRSSTPAPGNQATVVVGSHVELIALPVRNVPVRVLLPDGGSPETAKLSVKSVRGAEVQTWTPSAATLRLTPGVYRVSVTVGGSTTNPQLGVPEYTSPEVAVVVAESGDPEAVVVQLTLRSGIQGRLIGLEPSQSTYSYVWAAPVKDGVIPDAKALRRSSHRGWARGSNPVFVVRDLEPGMWAIAASAPGRHQDLGDIITVKVGSGMTRVELRVPDADGGVQHTVQVRSPEGTLLGDVSFQLRYGNNNARYQPLARTRTADGAHQLSWQGAIKSWVEKSKEPVKLVLEVHSPRYGSTSVPVTLDQGAVQVQFAEPAMLEVTVTGYAGSGYEGRLGVQIGVPNSPGNAGGWNRGMVNGRRGGANLAGKLDAQGRYLYGPSSPGKVTVTLTVTPTAAQRSQGINKMNGTPKTVELTPGMNRVSLELPQLHGVTVSVPGARPGHKVKLSGGNGFQTKEQDCSSGQAAFTNLPAGRYWVYVWNSNDEGDGSGDPSVGNMSAEVPGSGVIHFVRTPEDAAHVSIWDEDESPMSKAGFEDGDQIIAVNGTAFDGHKQFVKLVAGAKTAKIAFTVLREGGKTAKVSFDRDLLIAGLTDDGESTQADIWVGERDDE